MSWAQINALFYTLLLPFANFSTERTKMNAIAIFTTAFLLAVFTEMHGTDAMAQASTAGMKNNKKYNNKYNFLNFISAGMEAHNRVRRCYVHPCKLRTCMNGTCCRRMDHTSNSCETKCVPCLVWLLQQWTFVGISLFVKSKHAKMTVEILQKVCIFISPIFNTQHTNWKRENKMRIRKLFLNQ